MYEDDYLEICFLGHPVALMFPNRRLCKTFYKNIFLYGVLVSDMGKMGEGSSFLKIFFKVGC